MADIMRLSTMSKDHSFMLLCLLLAFIKQSCSETQMSAGNSSSSYPQRRYSARSVDCQNVSEIVFLSYFPCVRSNSDFVALNKLDECDLLAEAAAHLAVDRINQDPTILPNITLKLYPMYIPSGNTFITVSS